MNKFSFSLILTFFLIADASAQFSRADSLRGSLNEFRSPFDVHFYDLEVTVFPDSSIKGRNTVHFTMMGEYGQEMQLDLFENLKVEKILFGGMDCYFRREGNAIFLRFPQVLQRGEKQAVTVYYSGTPQKAKNAPWDGGFVWKQDANGKPWIGVACEGLGASVWWPLKDHLSDEPDSMAITIKLPPGPLNKLSAISNGQIRREGYLEDGTHEFKWFVSYPINSYNVTLNIGDYAHFRDTYRNASGDHDLDYYVLSNNLDKAKKHFRQVKEMLDCFEKYFGEYPFWKDGYALVESDYWGMEHQGAIAYGNKYKNNTWGWDYIIVHESGHEWWGNHVSAADHAELWIHESFCTYSEAIYMECRYGLEKAIAYLKSQSLLIANKEPIIGPLGVNYNHWEDTDMYYKGAWALHTLRNCIQNDTLWFATLKGIQEKFGMKTTNTREVVSYINEKTGRDWTAFFDQYFYHAEIPTLEYRTKKRGKNMVQVDFRLLSEVKDFSMPVGFKSGKLKQVVEAKTEWQSFRMEGSTETVMPDKDLFYLNVVQLGKRN